MDRQVGVVGAGTIGAGVGRFFAEVVLLAVPWDAVDAVLRAALPWGGHLPFAQLVAPVHPGECRASFLSGDEDEAKAEVAAVLTANNFAPIDLGGLHAAAYCSTPAAYCSRSAVRSPASTCGSQADNPQDGNLSSKRVSKENARGR